ncbi:acetyl-CoA acetyltransferase [Azospirillum sp. RWY-5-1]|uniref:Acetyl-CoA acetyltransferase n=1 Tax=Azospirillum oleiclasticum TaxID=2735135 RepID=A0ABX2TIJ8_9PROT|nr:acetyl-CoA acetyltransferase [Azospirillum oleiclasticum]NYZ16121.1 acetyl-CoA acetyltransferase [Azospirillum oleiclasticum]NYZ23002.1 acetyl-CoA acetyltransferase [Azospirillum oleiclasticum]
MDSSASPAIIGWSHEPFTRADPRSVERMIIDAAAAAIAHAGVEPAEIDEIWLGHFNSGFVRQDFSASLALGVSPDLRFRRATRVENACATGSAAVHAALRGIRVGDARVALVVGVEKMSEVPPKEVGEILLHACYVAEESGIEAGFAGVFGKIAAAYFERHGDQSDALAAIAAKNHANGCDNPYAQMRRDIGYAFCREPSEKNPFVAGPLKRTDCSLVSDGAAALVLASADRARSAPRAVGFRAAVQVNDVMPMSRRDILAFEGPRETWARGLAAAGAALSDLSFAEVHDCFTMAELMIYEAMGLAEPGQGARAIAEGTVLKDGRLPVNRSGGLKAKGHPIGATGVSMHALAAMQLTGSAGDLQIPGATLGATFNMGGAAVANYLSVLEPRHT